MIENKTAQGSLLGERLIPMSKGGSSDIFQTPPEAFAYLRPYIDKSFVVWESAAGKGMLANAMRNSGYDVIDSDILAGQNYFTYEPDYYDIQITTPPYSLKNKWLERCYQIGKPFALLLSVSSLHSAFRCNLYRKYGLQLVVPPKRINFITPSGRGSGSWFAVAWFCWRLNLEQDIVFPEPELAFDLEGDN